MWQKHGFAPKASRGVMHCQSIYYLNIILIINFKLTCWSHILTLIPAWRINYRRNKVSFFILSSSMIWTIFSHLTRLPCKISIHYILAADCFFQRGIIRHIPFYYCAVLFLTCLWYEEKSVRISSSSPMRLITSGWAKLQLVPGITTFSIFTFFRV